MPWEKTYDEAEVVHRAMHAFWARGYEATTIRDLVAATGLNRGSLYSAFTDKRTLFLAALRRYDRDQRERFLARLARDNSPREAILAAFAAAAETPADTPPGCLLVNTALELSPHDAGIRGLVSASLAAVEAFFADRVAAAQAAGTVPAARDPQATAQALLALFLGLRVLTRAGTGRPARDAVTVQAEVLLS